MAYLLMNFSGGLLGLLSFAPMANRLGRRGTFAVYHVGAGLLAPVTYLGGFGYAGTLVLLSVMAFFVLGMHAGYAIYFPELFPTRLRATGSSVCFNMGRVLGADHHGDPRIPGSFSRTAPGRRRYLGALLARPRHPLVRPGNSRPRAAGMTRSPSDSFSLSTASSFALASTSTVTSSAIHDLGKSARSI